MSVQSQQGTAFGPLLLDTKGITKLTDAASELFRVSYDLERSHKQAIKARLADVLTPVDLFGPGMHYRNDEEYRPGGDAR